MDSPQQVVVRLPAGPEPHPERDRERLRAAAARELRVDAARLGAVQLERCSFDARRRHRDWRVVLQVWRPGERPPPPAPTSPPELRRAAPDAPRVVVVGSGPAGLFAALDLAAGGLRVVVCERGGDVRERRRPLAELNRGHGVDPESNYCFGEGGAGTYSDGKLYSRTGSRPAVRAVLETLVAHGAPAAILTSWRPHIGSNRLPQVVRSLRQTLERAGAEVRFHTRVTELSTSGDPRRIRAVELSERGGPRRELDCDAVVFATGHSAADSLATAARAGARLVPKGFALGVRAEHPQPLVDEHQYGGLRAAHQLPAAFYELVAQCDGRGVYSFCMCPGGWIVPTTTAADRVVVNGMSLSRRDSPFANSGLVVAVEPEDWCAAGEDQFGWREALPELPPAPVRPEDDPLYGVRLQEALERRAARLGGGAGRAPSQRLDSFAAAESSAPPPLRSSYRPGLTAVDLRTLLPRGLARRLRAGLEQFERSIPGYCGETGQLIGVESRTSSPVRIARDRETLVAEGLAGLYPAGEGAGYAGGIVSAALDGRRAAAAVLAALVR
jgi:uncharacterized FAD-dependent dehydrogenase